MVAKILDREIMMFQTFHRTSGENCGKTLNSGNSGDNEVQVQGILRIQSQKSRKLWEYAQLRTGSVINT